MAETTLGRAAGLNLPKIRVNAVEWVMAHRELAALLALMAIAAALRLWGLGDKALHHDESLHAQFTYQLFNGQGYIHDPLMHGPFLFHAGAAVFFLFGDSEFTGRLLPALFGTALVGMPYFLRGKLGWTAVLIAAVLLTFSPTLLYVTRFFRHDPYVLVWMLACVICIWRYLEEQKRGYLYLFGLFLGLAFATMEITFIYVAIMLVYVDLMLAAELGRAREGESRSRDWASRLVLSLPYGLALIVLGGSVVLGLELHRSLGVVLALAAGVAATSLATLAVLGSRDSSQLGRDELVSAVALAPFAWLLAAAWPLLGARPFGRDRLPAAGDIMIVLGTLSLTQFGAAIEVLPFVGDKGYNVEAEQDLRNVTVITLLVGAAYVGLLWRPWVWLIAAAAFFIPYVLLFTTFFFNFDGVLTGQHALLQHFWASLDYWLSQQDVARGDQPVYYYALLSPLYEFLPLLLALPGLFWLVIRANSLSRWLVFWLGGVLLALSLAGEKMPWLESHIALPLALCGAVALGRLVDSLAMDAKRWLMAAGLGAVASAATLLLVEAESGFVLAVGLLAGALLLGWVAGSALGAGSLGLLRSLTAVAVAVLLTLTVRASYTVSFVNYDTPVELLVYTQTSPDIPVIMDRIEALARESGMGYNLPIAVDQTDGYAWPWAWYLRHYHDVAYINEGAIETFQPKDGSVLLLHANNVARFDGLGYAQVPFKHRWWFSETYRGLTVNEVADTLTSPRALRALGDFFLYRRDVTTTTGSTNGVAFFPESLAAFDTKATPAQPAPEPAVLADGRIVFGRSGSGPGELLQAADVYVDASGVIWVADARNHRIHRFDASGRYLGSLGRGGPNPGTFNQPWSVAVDAEGFIYVADTWNHRIQKFSPDLQLVKAWGEATNAPDPTPLQLYGPRDIVIDAAGTLWVTDTGHKRLVNYSRDGEPLGVYGQAGSSPGQLSEPVGLAVDAAGAIYIADAWNSRVQVLRNGVASILTLTDWSSQAVADKPYLAVLADGRIVVTDPAAGTLVLYGANGQLAGRWKPTGDGKPLGIAALAGGGFVFSDSLRNEVQIVPVTAMSSLFTR